MSDYESIHGTRVKYLTSDPTLESSYEGQVWFNSTSGTLKTVVQSEAWSSSSPLSTARYYAGGAGTQTAGLVFGGNVPPYSTATEEYNGSGWSTGGSLSTARTGMVGTGT